MDYDYLIDLAYTWDFPTDAIRQEVLGMLRHNASRSQFARGAIKNAAGKTFDLLLSRRSTHGIPSLKIINQVFKEDKQTLSKRHAYSVMITFMHANIINSPIVEQDVKYYAAALRDSTDIYQFNLKQTNDLGTWRTFYHLRDSRCLLVVKSQSSGSMIVAKVYRLDAVDVRTAMSILLHDYLRVRRSIIEYLPVVAEADSDRSYNNQPELDEILSLYNEHYSARKEGTCDFYPDLNSKYFNDFKRKVAKIGYTKIDASDFYYRFLKDLHSVPGERPSKHGNIGQLVRQGS